MKRDEIKGGDLLIFIPDNLVWLVEYNSDIGNKCVVLSPGKSMFKKGEINHSTKKLSYRRLVVSGEFALKKANKTTKVLFGGKDV